MNGLLVLPILIPMFSAAVMLLLYRWRRMQRVVSMAGMVALEVAAIALLVQACRHDILVVQIGNWPAPYGITLVADLFGAIMVLLAGTIGMAVMIYALSHIDSTREYFGFHPLYHFLLMGICGAFLTGDLFNLYVWFEVMLMASFVLLAMSGERGQMEGAIKYVVLNLMSSALFLAALGLLYGLAGTLNMADLANKLSTLETYHVAEKGAITTLSLLFLVAFGIKAAIFPLFFWLPASYHTPPVSISAVFAGLLTKVGMYAMLRVFTLIFVHDTAFTHGIILVLAVCTMVTGVLGAVAQVDMRRLLSFHIISQIGYLLMGLGLLNPLALGGTVFFTVHVSISKTLLFLISGVVNRLGGSFELKKLGGLYRTQPGLAMFFLIPAMSLAGLPPLSGFFAKLSLVQAGLLEGQYLVVATALGVSLLTLFSMIKIWNEAFWKPSPPTEGEIVPEGGIVPVWNWLPSIAILAAIILFLGFAAAPVFQLALRTGEQLMNPVVYIHAVLGEAR